MSFEILKKDAVTGARIGQLQTLHGNIETPIFMPVGTQATVKALTPQQLTDCGAQIILGNTYHLHLRPTSELIRGMGGLHRFMAWERPILTDSGGFQVFSLAKLRKISDEGITFQSHIDGRSLFLDPKCCFEIQENLGTDIAMILDQCPPYPCEHAEVKCAVERTLRWAEVFKRSAVDSGFLRKGHHVFGIVQGSHYPDLRKMCAESMRELEFPGYAVGGVSVGEPEKEMLEQVEMTLPYLPESKPRYVMGVGTPVQLLKMIAMGADMFDCVMPTRLARHGTAFTPSGTLNIRNEQYKTDDRPLVDGLNNYTCAHFSRSYLRHLVIANELLAHTLLSIHNIHFFLDLMKQARAHLLSGDFDLWQKEWCANYIANAK